MLTSVLLFTRRRIGRLYRRKTPGSYLVAKTATRSAGLRTEPSGESVAEPFVLSKGPLGKAREGVKAHEGYMRLLKGWLFGRRLTQYLDGRIVLMMSFV